MQAGRHDPLQVFEHLGPGERLALEQIVEKLGAVAGAAIGGQVKDGFGFGFLLVAGGNLLLGAVRSGCGLCRAATQPETALYSRIRVNRLSAAKAPPQRSHRGPESS